MTRHVVAALADFPPGARMRVVIEGRAVAVFNIGGELFALQDRCPHRGGSLCEGRLTGKVEAAQPGHYEFSRAGEILRCPWHGWEFDVRTGLSRCAPMQWRARTFEVGVACGEDLDEADLRIETFPVAVEDAYVVVTVQARAPGG